MTHYSRIFSQSFFCFSRLLFAVPSAPQCANGKILEKHTSPSTAYCTLIGSWLSRKSLYDFEKPSDIFISSPWMALYTHSNVFLPSWSCTVILLILPIHNIHLDILPKQPMHPSGLIRRAGLDFIQNESPCRRTVLLYHG